MIQTIFYGYIPASRGLRMLAAAAMAALALSACSGGGGGGGGGASTGGGSSAAFKQPRLTVRGVTANINFAAGSASLGVSQNNISWTINAGVAPDGPGSGSWSAVTKLNDLPTSRTHRFHLASDIASFEDSDYLAYGHWSVNFAPPLPTTKPDFEPFFYGNMPYTGTVPASAGRVSYNGAAAGIFGTIKNPAWGYFRSDIELTADFAAGTVMAALSNIQGLSGLSPSFNFSDITTSPIPISNGRFATTRWGGRFFGPSGARPTGAAGWIDGLISASSDAGGGGARLYGSFGAKP